MKVWSFGCIAILLSSFTALGILNDAVNFPVIAQNDAVFVCIKKYRDLGISPDAAAQECRSQDFTAEQKTCIEGRKNNQLVFQAQSGPDASGEYLIDLKGTSWEENDWQSRRCRPNFAGEKKSTRQTGDFLGTTAQTWFYSGYCKVSSLTVDYSLSHDRAIEACVGTNPNTTPAPTPTPVAPATPVSPTIIVLPGNGVVSIPGTTTARIRELKPVEGPNYNGWYRYEKPSNISDDAMQQAGAAFHNSPSSCAISGYCLSLNGSWISKQSTLQISVTSP